MPPSAPVLTPAQQRWIDADKDGATQLAVLLSLASLIDPGLLREARIALKLPVTAELELRCSPVLSSGTLAGLILADEALPTLRARLHPALFDLAWKLTSARHAALSPALVLEETLTWQGLSGQGGADADAEIKLNRALVALVRGRKTQLAAWAARALPRLPDRIQAQRSFRYLANAVQLSGYRSTAALRADGPPPAWMLASQVSSTVQAGIALFDSTLEITCPPRDGEPAIPLPENRQVWISWWQDGQRVWAEKTIPRNRTLAIPIAGAEITIEAPTLGRILIQDEAAPRVELAYFDEISTDSRNDLIDYLQTQLSASGNRVAPGFFPSFYSETYSQTAKSDFLLIVAPSFNIGAEGPFLDFITSQCRPMIFVKAPYPSQVPAFVDREAIPVIDFDYPPNWESAMVQLRDRLAKGPPPLAPLDGVPPLAPVFVRRPAIFNELKRYLLQGSDPVVNLYGDLGRGRTMAAVDLVHDCAIRRRFHGGIFWGDNTRHDLPNELPHPCLVIGVDTGITTYAELDIPDDFVSNGSRALYLTVWPFSQEVPLPAVDGATWWMAESLGLFQKAASATGNHEEINAALDLVRSDPDGGSSSKGSQPFDFMNARMIANLGWLAGMAARSNAELTPPPDTFPLSEARRQLLFHLDLVAPFSACPPDWKFPDPDLAIWRRFFAPDLHPRIYEAHHLLAEGFPDRFPDRDLTPAASEALVELALPTHRRIVESYRAECGGDWAIGPDDGYFLKYFAWHLWHAHPDQITHLTENLDWLWRADRDAPDWARLLSPKLHNQTYLYRRPNLRQDFGDFARDLKSRLRSVLAAVSVEDKEARRMGEARLAMMQGHFRGRILVVGTRTDALDPTLARLSEAVGRELARWGYSLLTDGSPGVDAASAKAYAAQLATNNISPDNALFDSSQIAFPAEPRQGGYEPREGSDWNDALVNSTDAIIVIGGDDDTLAFCRLASQQGKPVLPIRNTGGAAETLFNENSTIAPYLAELPTLEGPIDSPAACYELAKALIALLPVAEADTPPESSFPATEIA